MNRTDFFTITVSDSISEYDHLHNTLSRFVMNYPVSYYRIMQDDILRPDLISYKAYGTVQYWWLVCFVNEIKNPFVDITVGKLMKIPNILDIYQFYKQYSLR